MMQGRLEHREVDPALPRRYRVVARAGGWAVAVHGAMTRPLPDRGAAEMLAARLQAEADRLNRDQHRRTQ